MKGDGLRKGAWSEEEDALLKKCIHTYGEGNWYQIPARAGLNRCRKSCRLRWLNYLRPNIKRGDIQEDEVDMILRLHKLLGNRWSLIAGRIPGRTANDVKNYWNTHLAKKFSSSVSAKLPKKHNNVVKVNAIRPRPRTFKNNLYLVRATYPQFSNNQGGSPPPQPPQQPPPPPPPPPPQSNDLSWLETFLDDSYYVGEGGGTSEGRISGSGKHLHGVAMWSIDDEELNFDDTQLWDLLNMANDDGVSMVEAKEPTLS